MDNQRLLVWAFFGVMLFLTWQAWLEDYGPTGSPPAAVESPSDDPLADELPDIGRPDEAGSAASDVPALPQAPPSADEPQTTAPGERVVTVSTDVFDVEIGTNGATLRGATLKKYPVAKDNPDVVVELLTPAPEDLGLIESGVGLSGDDGEQPNHLARFEPDARQPSASENSAKVTTLPPGSRTMISSAP